MRCWDRRARVVGVTVLLNVMLALASVHSAPITYEHDSKGRLVKATHPDGTIVDYTYDANGNRTGAAVTAPPPDTTAPSAPGVPTISAVTGTSAMATWTAATDDVGVVGYDYRLDSGSWQALGNVLTVNLTGLTNATGYTFQVRARDGAANLSAATSKAFTTLDTTAPSTPSGLSGSAANSTTVNLSWTAATDNVAVTGYKIFRNGGQIGTSATTSYADNTVAGSTAYSYRVSAYDAANNQSAQSSAVTVTTPDTIAPTTPSSLVASAPSPSQVNLSWSASTDAGGSGLAGYRIYRGGVHIATTGGATYSDTTVAAGTAYSYTVAAYDSANNISGQSNTASATTPQPVQATVNKTVWSWFYRQGGALPNPSNVVVTASGGVGGYTYAWQRVSGDTQISATSPTSNSTGFTRNVAEWDVTYEAIFRCLVTDSNGNTAYSPNVTVTFRKNSLQ